MSNKEDRHHELMTRLSQVWIPASFWHVCFKYSTFRTSQNPERLAPEKSAKSPETKEILQARIGLLSLLLMICCCLILVHIRHFCSNRTDDSLLMRLRYSHFV